MRTYCTLFDKKYAPKGIAMIRSLMDHSLEPIDVHVLALDEESRGIVSQELAGYPVKVHHLLEMTNPSNVNARELYSRMARDYSYFCWTMASVFLDHVLSLPGIWQATYLDADLFFFNDPSQIFSRFIQNKGVAIVPHRFPKKDAERLSPNGQFNVSWVTFTRAMQPLLKYWKERCILKCDAESCGDQKYLDEWPEIAGDAIKVLDHPGIGLAPWNVSDYSPRIDDSRLVIDIGEFTFKVYFYHFHEHHRKGKERTGYPLRSEDIKFIYEPYEKALEPIEQRYSCESIR